MEPVREATTPAIDFAAPDREHAHDVHRFALTAVLWAAYWRLSRRWRVAGLWQRSRQFLIAVGGLRARAALRSSAGRECHDRPR